MSQAVPDLQIPVLDFGGDFGGGKSAAQQDKLSRSVDHALTEIGFMSVSNLGVDNQLLSEVYAASKDFFTGSADVKRASAYVSAIENFGYQGVAEENLDPSAPADLKETFTMRNILQRPPDLARWPSAAFRDLMCAFYADVLDAGYALQRVLTRALNVDEDFFVRCHSGENVSLRLLYYPASGVEAVATGQMGAGAHTDYGLLTMLFQDEVGGLQVLDKDNKWQDVAPISQAIVINSGDLLERWTNGRYQSTVHRVTPRVGEMDRLSIAMFIDPDSDTEVRALDSCTDEGNPPRLPAITAGEHLQQKLAASHKDRFAR